jgi:hypothetical protein
MTAANSPTQAQLDGKACTNTRHAPRSTCTNQTHCVSFVIALREWRGLKRPTSAPRPGQCAWSTMRRLHAKVRPIERVWRTERECSRCQQEGCPKCMVGGTGYCTGHGEAGVASRRAAPSVQKAAQGTALRTGQARRQPPLTELPVPSMTDAQHRRVQAQSL